MKAPIEKRNVGLAQLTKPIELRLPLKHLREEFFETFFTDLTNIITNIWRKVILICEEVQERSCITNSFDITQDKLWEMIKK